ncbi:MAG TPA: protein-disulfide reductase DsbD family protein, partial [Pirellulaceae bacterium]|nr:protein-disulfide reductase DsbD family protein [Pirellulaceae bacterium]
DWDKPPGILPADSKGGRIYKNQVVWTRPIMREVQLPAAGAMQLEVAFQACNDRLCLPPDKVTQLVDWPD